MERIKITETGFSDNPLIAVFSKDKDKKNCLRMDCSGFKENCFFRITRKQAERLAEFLLKFSKKR